MKSIRKRISARMLAGLLIFVGVMIFVGFLMRGKLNALLRTHIENSVAAQLELLSKNTQYKLDAEITRLAEIAEEIRMQEANYAHILDFYSDMDKETECTYGL